MTYTTKLGLAIAANVGVNLVGAGISVPYQTEKYFDTCGSLAFLSSAGTALYLSTGLQPSLMHTRHILLGVTTSVWAVRLLAFLTSRVHRMKGDRRFDEIKKNSKRFITWVIQTLWVGIVSFPTVAVLATPSIELAPVGWLTTVGFGIWGIGFAFEVVADWQKASWQNKLGEKRFNQFIQTGLWSLSRYPNYFGEIALWSGSYLMAAASFPRSIPTQLGFLASPLFVSLLLLRVSGIPLQEKQAKARFAGNKAFEEYVKNTNLIIPGKPHRKSM